MWKQARPRTVEASEEFCSRADPGYEAVPTFQPRLYGLRHDVVRATTTCDQSSLESASGFVGQ